MSLQSSEPNGNFGTMNKPLSPEQVQALRVIHAKGIVRGRDLKRFASIKTNKELKETLETLSRNQFVTLQSGSSFLESEDAALNAYVVQLPSGVAAVEAELKRAE